jgi:endonuclease/exonuclease/phosphatase family metal-dependent hydrolase
MKKFFFAIFCFFTILLAVIYCGSCLTPFISPVQFWPFAFLALAFPYLFVLILFLAFVWIFVKRSVSAVLLLLLFVGYKNIFATFALDAFPTSSLRKPESTLRVLTWNVRGFDNPSIAADSANSSRRRMFNFIAETDPDILCLQEFSENYFKGTLSNTLQLKKMGYRFFYRTDEMPNHFPYGTVLNGTAIFSKIPIIDSGKIMLGDTSYPEHLAFVDVSFQNKLVRIFAAHFKSINLFASPTAALNKVIFYGDSDFVYKSSKFEKLRKFGQAHTAEAIIAKDAINKSPYPVIIGIDMNSVPTSYPYHLMSKGLQDAFKLHGWGLGTTLDSLPKTLRIDFLLVDQRLTIKNYDKEELHLSDHFPQLIDVEWHE